MFFVETKEDESQAQQEFKTEYWKTFHETFDIDRCVENVNESRNEEIVKIENEKHETFHRFVFKSKIIIAVMFV